MTTSLSRSLTDFVQEAEPVAELQFIFCIFCGRVRSGSASIEFCNIALELAKLIAIKDFNRFNQALLLEARFVKRFTPCECRK